MKILIECDMSISKRRIKRHNTNLSIPKKKVTLSEDNEFNLHELKKGELMFLAAIMFDFETFFKNFIKRSCSVKSHYSSIDLANLFISVINEEKPCFNMEIFNEHYTYGSTLYDYRHELTNDYVERTCGAEYRFDKCQNPRKLYRSLFKKLNKFTLFFLLKKLGIKALEYTVLC